jgi:hypothetical protein
MVADATFVQQRHRDAFRELATALGSGFLIVDCAAPPALLEERLRQRMAGGADASDADLAVLRYQLAHHDPLTAAERRVTVPLDAGGDAAAAVARIQARVRARVRSDPDGR